jgi:hypothetical protein
MPLAAYGCSALDPYPLRLVTVPDPHGSPEQMTGSLPDGQRADTAPLVRDHTRVQGPAPNPSGTGEATRPAFVPPDPPSTPQSLAHPSTSRQPTPAPSTAPRPQATAASTRITPMGWFARGAGLFAISLVSGLIWLAIKPPKPVNPAHTTAPATKYAFTKTHMVDGGSQQGCKNASKGKIKDFFEQHPCQHLTRALYTTTIDGNQRVLTSVVTVLMPDAASAAQLNSLTTKDGTGNIEDLSSDKDGPEVPRDFPSLRSDTGYWSEPQDRMVVVGESAYFGKSSPQQDPTLVGVTRDALQLGWPQDSTPK